MKRRMRRKPLPCLTLAALALFAGLSAGCRIEESIVDGIFGGVSDTIAAVITNALLAATAQAP